MQHYPASTLVLKKGKYYVQVTVPRDLRPFFKGQKQKQVSTGTADQAEAKRRQHDITTSIYKRFDHAKRELDPLVVAANDAVAPLNHPGWTADSWDPEHINHTAQEVRFAVGSVLYVDLYDSSGQPKFDPEESMAIAKLQQDMEPAYDDFEEQLSVRRRVSSDCRLTVSEIAALYWPTKTFNRIKTEKAYKAGIEKFIRFTNDSQIAAIDRKTAKQFVDRLALSCANNTLQRDVGTVRGLFDFAVDQEYVPVNPFSSVTTKNRGVSPKQGRPLRRSQLEQLFQMELNRQDRLCLSILAATGMRLDEATLLAHEDIRIEGGIRYFDLTKANKVVKNQSAMREVPVHPHLNLPSGTGRLFDYRVDADGKAQAAASKKLMKHIKLVRDDSDDTRVNVHSLRHTFKDLMRDAGIPKDAQDSIIGHKELGQGGDYGGGYSLSTKASYIELIDISFLC